jgi:AcrR family transcriptional regulator
MPLKKTSARARARDKTRHRLQEISLRLFVRRGYAGTTVRDIADAAGLSVGLMFHYFPSKQALLEEHARNIDAGTASLARQLASATRPLETFSAVAATVLESMTDARTRDLFLLASQILSLDSIPRPVKRLVSATRSIDASVPLIARGQRLREIRAGDPKALAIAFWGALQGIAEVLVWYRHARVPGSEEVLGLLRPSGDAEPTVRPSAGARSPRRGSAPATPRRTAGHRNR